MVTDLSIANDALIEMGQPVLLSLSDVQNNETGRVAMQSVMQKAIDLILAKHPFASTIKRQVLSPLEETPVNQYEFKFSLPADYGVMFALSDEDRTVLYLDGWTREGRSILTNYNPLAIYYGRKFQQDDLGDLDDHIADAISAYLVWKTCKVFGYSSKDQNDKYTVYKDRLREAKARDQREYPHLQWLVDTWQKSMMAAGPII